MKYVQTWKTYRASYGKNICTYIFMHLISMICDIWMWIREYQHIDIDVSVCVSTIWPILQNYQNDRLQIVLNISFVFILIIVIITLIIFISIFFFCFF